MYSCSSVVIVESSLFLSWPTPPPFPPPPPPLSRALFTVGGWLGGWMRACVSERVRELIIVSCAVDLLSRLVLKLKTTKFLTDC